ncbi:MAG: SpoIIE family protein phosphatase [Bacteroidales bacterium]|nr:SpoIIE family protein phosphatase [Bacteroidales bacterium]
MKKLLHYIKVLVTITAVCWATHAAAVLPCGDLKCRITEIVVTTADGTHDYTSSQLQENPVIKMPYDRNSIKFVFLGETEDDNCRNAIEYSTKLDNYNESWTSWSNLREADFVNLRDGAYEFRVRAKYSDEIITDIASYKFIVKTPFYRSVTAYILYSIGLIAATVAIIIFYKRSFNKERNTLLNRIQEREEGLLETNRELKQQKESLDKTIKDLSMLSSSGQNIIKNLTIKEISMACFKELNNFFKTDNLSIGIFNAVHNSLDFSAFIMDGELMPFARYNLENTDNLNVWCFLNEKSIVLDDYKKQIGEYIAPEFKPDTDLCGSAVFIPLFDSDMAVGVMSITNPDKYFFNNYHISIIHNFATYVETAIANFYIFRKLNTQKRLLEDRGTQLEETYNNLKISQETVAKVNSELSKLSVAVKNTDNAVSIFDADGNLEWINIGYTKVYGYSFDDIIHKSFNIETVFKDHELIAKYRKVYESGRSLSFSHSNINADGKIIWLQTTLTPILNAEGHNVNQIVAVESDITEQKKAESEIIKQRNEIDIKNKDLTKSIEYASTIQKALMPDQHDVQRFFKKVFMLNLPKDIVSGDFFWITQKFGRKYFALCDCAGHGVPGAFVSLMGKMFLDEILHSVKLEDSPAVIIRQLNDKMHESVSSLSNKVGGIDGMDLSFCIVNSRNTMLQYAGAYRPLFIVRNGELIKVLPDRCSLGNIAADDDFKFTNHDIPLKENDLIVLSSDGYADQFGHVNGKKLGRSNFAELLVEASKLDTNEMAEFFDTKHREWKGELEQVDDILVTGIKIEFDTGEKLYDDDEDEE